MPGVSPCVGNPSSLRGAFLFMTQRGVFRRARLPGGHSFALRLPAALLLGHTPCLGSPTAVAFSSLTESCVGSTAERPRGLGQNVKGDRHSALKTSPSSHFANLTVFLQKGFGEVIILSFR